MMKCSVSSKVAGITGCFLFAAGLLSVFAQDGQMGSADSGAEESKKSDGEGGERYAVVHKKNYKFEESYSVMPDSEYRKIKSGWLMESRHLRSAMTRARLEWNQAEYDRVGDGNRNRRDKGKNDRRHDSRNDNSYGKKGTKEYYRDRKKPFPSVKINTMPSFTCIKLYESQAEADARCQQLSESLKTRLEKGFTLRRSDAGDSDIGGRLGGKMESKLSGPKQSGGGSKKGGRNKHDSSKDHAEIEAQKDADEAKAMEMFEKHLAAVRKEAEDSPGISMMRPQQYGIKKNNNRNESGGNSGKGGSGRRTVTTSKDVKRLGGKITGLSK